MQDNVYDYIREGLMAGEYAPGAHLTVRGVAAALGTSVMPVREAFKRFSAEGALEPLSTGATRVPVFDSQKLQNLMEIRMLIEGLAVRRASIHMSTQEYSALEKCDREIRDAIAAGESEAEAKANEQFHFCIYRAARSAELLRIIEHLWLQVGPYVAWMLKHDVGHSRLRGARAFRHHKQIMLALRRRNGDDAEAALRADLATVVTVLMEKVRPLPSEGLGATSLGGEISAAPSPNGR